jgi:spore maturation protein CgeB
MRVVLLGLSITSSWGNGHATNYRALVRALSARGHDVLFLERDMPWYAAQRDLPRPPWGTTHLYGSLDELRAEHAGAVRDADVVVVGSYVPEGVAVGEWVIATTRGVPAFYDIDTPVTLAKLARGDHEYLAPDLIPRFDLYLSFTGGPTLRRLEDDLGAPMARALYCSVDEAAYRPPEVPLRYDLAYLGTYSADRQPKVEALLLEPARAMPEARFAVAGAQYPDGIGWPANVERAEHLPPPEHPAFYAAQRFTLNVTRADMVAAGWSPSVRLFEAGACGTPVISDPWDGLAALFRPGEEILLAETPGDVLRALRDCPEERRRAVGAAARAKVLARHTAAVRARELETMLLEAAAGRAGGRPAAGAASGRSSA